MKVVAGVAAGSAFVTVIDSALGKVAWIITTCASARGNRRMVKHCEKVFEPCFACLKNLKQQQHLLEDKPIREALEGLDLRADSVKSWLEKNAGKSWIRYVFTDKLDKLRDDLMAVHIMTSVVDAAIGADTNKRVRCLDTKLDTELKEMAKQLSTLRAELSSAQNDKEFERRAIEAAPDEETKQEVRTELGSIREELSRASRTAGGETVAASRPVGDGGTKAPGIAGNNGTTVASLVGVADFISELTSETHHFDKNDDSSDDDTFLKSLVVSADAEDETEPSTVASATAEEFLTILNGKEMSNSQLQKMYEQFSNRIIADSTFCWEVCRAQDGILITFKVVDELCFRLGFPEGSGDIVAASLSEYVVPAMVRTVLDHMYDNGVKWDDWKICYDALARLEDLYFFGEFRVEREVRWITTIIYCMNDLQAKAGVQAWCCSELGHRCYGVKGFVFRREICEARGIQAIIHGMNTHRASADVQKEGCFALDAIAFGGTGADAIREANGIPAIIVGMSAHLDCEDIQWRGCEALGRLAHNNPANLEAIARTDGVRDLLRELEKWSERDNYIFWLYNDLMNKL